MLMIHSVVDICCDWMYYNLKMSSIVLMILLVTVSTTENRFNVGESYSGTALKINEGRAFQEIQLTLHSQKYLFIDFSLTPPLPQVNLSIHLEDAS